MGLSNDHENGQHEANALSCIDQGSGGVSHGRVDGGWWMVGGPADEIWGTERLNAEV
jgi:hypothetical protein